ncbi:MAG: 6-phosphofructokinase [Clostridia bacterium]|nr:6-phosphofructokinase [Clostridia bacterium]MBN2884203.1 6-phosphofructokinase [Clostridia bacterium]
MTEKKRIGVLTSGGDAPGMNAAIRAVVRTGYYYDLEVYGIYRGYEGLINGEIEKLLPRDVSGILQDGGTFLKTARSPRFHDDLNKKKAAEICRAYDIEIIVVIGGDGSYRGALDFSKHGVPVIALPGTIDNDIGCTEYTIGFDTALNTVMDSIDKVRDTAYSHERCTVIEVMGRRAGYIAINDGIAGGADVILIPEAPFNVDRDVIKPILECRNRGKRDFCIIVAEGVGNATSLCDQITEKTGIISRATILGYVQRGGSPTAYDRIMASRMGAKAVELIKEGKINRVVSLIGNKLVDFDLEEALSMKNELDVNMLKLAKIISI